MAASDDERTARSPRSGRPAGTLPPGTLLNGIYRIDALLGAGGMGEVYRATNIANDECDAVKVISRGLASQPMVEAMFRKEARVVGSIHSPAVARLKLFARDPVLDVLYFVTEYIPGPSLLDRLTARAAGGDELKVLMRRMATALVAVHEAGAVHRDLSPDNIILPGGELGKAKIIDFGIVKELDASHPTVLGAGFAGKFGYIAPEQLGFSGAQVGPWTDLYSLALVGIAFARGAPLGMGHTMGTAEERRREPIDLSSIPPDLAPMFGRMLAYDWQQRLGSAGEVLAMLDGAGAAPPPAWTPPVAPPAPPPEPAPPTAWPPPAEPPPSYLWQAPPPQPWPGEAPEARRSGGAGKIVAGAVAVLLLLVAGGFALRALWQPGAESVTSPGNLAEAMANGAGSTPTPAPTPTGTALTSVPSPVVTAIAPVVATPTPLPRDSATPAPRVRPSPSPRPTRSPTTYTVPPVVIPPPIAPVRTGLASPPRLIPGAYFSADDYPPAALRNEVQGSVRIQVTVSSSGRPTACAVTGSSGDGSLDAVSCRVAMTRMRFTPGTDDAGNPITSTYSKTIAWRLPSE